MTDCLYEFDSKNRRKPRHYRIAQELIGQYHLLTMQDTHEIYWFDEGVYKPKGEEIISSTINQKYGEDVTLQHTREILGHIQRETYTPRADFNSNPNIINLNNGYIDLNENPATFHKHAPSLLTTYKIPVTYDPTAKCPNIDKFFLDIVAYDNIFNLYEIPAYCLIPDHKLIQRAIMLVGEGDNGKSTYLDLIRTFLGHENTCSVPIQDLSKRFYAAELYGKLANIYPDLPTYQIKDTGTFKATTSGLDQIMGERKGRDPFYFINFAKQIYSANKIPKPTNDRTDAYYRRWHIINFPNTFPEGDPRRDPNLKNKITTPEELSGLLNKTLESLDRLKRQKQFTGAFTAEQNRELYEKLARGSEEVFIDENIQTTTDDSAFLTREELRAAYNKFCIDNKLPRKSKSELYDAIRALGAKESYRRPKGQREERTFLGVCWKDKEQEVEEFDEPQTTLSL